MAYRAKRCRDCFRQRQQQAINWDGVVHGFSAEWFKRQLARPDLDWTATLLSEATGGQVSRRTIANWLNGSHKPFWPSWRIVAQVLAWETCADCGGSGYSDPTARWLKLVPKVRQAKDSVERVKHWKAARSVRSAQDEEATS